MSLLVLSGLAVAETAHNPMVHSSLSTGSSKWGGDWGTATGKYGQFTCGTCHVRSTSNIKRIRTGLVSGSADLFPVQAASGDIQFLDARDGTSQFGDDSGVRTSSNRICEGCHTITSYHRFDPSGQADLNHYNRSDCTSCHKHNEGFKASGCTSCHGSTVNGQIWPSGSGGSPAYADDSAGAHDNHVEAISQYLGYGNLADLLIAIDTTEKQKAVCAFCHPDPGGSGHTNNDGDDNRVDVAGAGLFRKYTGGGSSALDATSGAYNYADASCSNLACHNGVTTPSGTNNWNSPPVGPTCALCHTGAGGSQRHDVHVTAKGYACTECHANHGTYPGGTAGLRHGDGLVQLVWTNSGSFENTFGGGSVTYSQTAPLPYRDDTWGTCASAACHNNKTSPAWNAAVTGNCGTCHADITADATHLAHTGAAATYGRSIVCASCHQAATDWTTKTPPASGHIDGAFSVAGNIAFSYSGATYPTVKGTCGTNVCHNSGAGGTPNRAYSWGTALANDCASCHLATPSSNAHNEHMSNGYTGAACTDCHTAASSASHMSGTVDFDAAKATYSWGASVAVGGIPSGTCATAACHNRGTPVTASAAWNTTGDLACDACHYYSATPTAAGNDAHFAPISGSHNKHFTAGKTCVLCHGADPETTSHIDGRTSLIDGAVALQGEAGIDFSHTSAATKYTFNHADYSCYSPTNNGLGCHATAGASGVGDATRPKWDVPFLSTACTSCHTNTTNTAVNPTSGLHGVTPTITGQRHDNSVTGGCAACHNTLVGLASHINGTFTGDTMATLGLRYYTQSAANTGTCATTSCHMGNSDDWAHVWTNAADYYTSSPSACGGCHGDWVNNWNSGVVHRTSDGTRSMHGTGTNYQCKDCHALEASTNAYTFAFGSGSAWGGTSKHGNSIVEVNSNGTAYDEASGYCTSCHTSGAYNFSDTGWPIAAIGGDAIAGNCDSCHGYPPTPGDGKTAQGVEGKGAHVKHVNHLKLRQLVTLDPAADSYAGANVALVCGVCHDTSDAANHMDSGNRNLRLPTSYQFGASIPSYNGTVGVSSSTTPKTCSSLGCHFRPTPLWAPVGGE